ncbi:MAG: SUMF1/EgtB/PvdO family nonheme iron enzyme [bacterium]|nr:SUMF1/EgtB/PvdO family nonheme iron enzyme [bacterium]
MTGSDHDKQGTVFIALENAEAYSGLKRIDGELTRALRDDALTILMFRNRAPSQADYDPKGYYAVNTLSLFACYIGADIDEAVKWDSLPEGRTFGSKVAYEFHRARTQLHREAAPLIYVFHDQSGSVHPKLAPILEQARADVLIRIFPVAGLDDFKAQLTEQVRAWRKADVRHVPSFLPGFDWADVTAGDVRYEDGEFVATGRQKAWARYRAQTLTVTAGFAIATTPITNAQYDVFVRDERGYRDPAWWDFSDAGAAWRADNPTPSAPDQPGEMLPRTNIAWFDAVAFCRWLEFRLKLPGAYEIRLPTDLEWQRAAVGDAHTRYPWGNDAERTETRANVSESGIGALTPVGQYPAGASPFGALDMTGSAWEWTASTPDDPAGAQADGDLRTLRGGSYDLPLEYGRAAARLSDDPANVHETIGFRVVLAPRAG